MFSAIRKHFSPATVLAFVALVFAITGGAFAASSSGGSGGGAGTHYTASAAKKKSKKKSSSKGARGPAGPAGKPGATGPAGAAGAQGANGTNGKDGTHGIDGAPGAAGTSVTVTESPNAIDGHCTGTTPATGKGGAKFEVAGAKAYACNGHEGSPWTAGGTLPAGSTETGGWSFGKGLEPPSASALVQIAVSFSIPLASSLDEEHVHFINAAGKEVKILGEEVDSTECLGTASSPSANPGNLCIYTGGLVEASVGGFGNSNPVRNLTNNEAGASTVGALLAFSGVTKSSTGVGTFAVTAE